MAVIAAEMIRANEGAGWIITTGMESGNTVQILAGMISIGLVGLLLASLLRLDVYKRQVTVQLEAGGMSIGQMQPGKMETNRR